MWNRGKRSVGLGLSNREIAELRYQGLYQVVDLTKNFYFSYTYDVTRSLQENFLTTSTRPFPPPPFKDMYVWNFFLTREFEACLDHTTSYYWIMPIIHGAFVQRKVNDYGRYLNIALMARRSRHFAGTRYLKRGVNEQGQVANDVEHEQILHDESLSPPGNFSSYLQVRGTMSGLVCGIHITCRSHCSVSSLFSQAPLPRTGLKRAVSQCPSRLLS
jgi:phosphatidylinositol 3,5-bisphosphate 5-phosphatase